MALAPDSLIRRGFVYRDLVALGAEFTEINGTACAMSCGESTADEVARARELAICDLSPLPRCGFKGRETVAWLTARGVAVSDDNHMTVVQEDGARAARLAPGEVLLLSDLAVKTTLCQRLGSEWSPEPDSRTYPVPRADTNCWFLLVGRRCAEMLAKVCGVDLRGHKFANGTIAQTSVARLNAIVIRDDLGDVPAYHLLTDSASASYMWMCLLDAMAEFEGKPVGLASVQKLNTTGGS